MMESKQIGDIVRRIPIFQGFSGRPLSIYRNGTAILCDRLRDHNILLEPQYRILEGQAEDERAS